MLLLSRQNAFVKLNPGVEGTHIVSVMVFVATWVVRVPFVAVTNFVVVLRVSAMLSWSNEVSLIT